MYAKLLASVVAASLLVAPVHAVAGPWDDTFQQAGGQVGGDGEGLIVVVAGEKTESAADAGKALADAARGSARLVMDASPLGDVSSLDDHAIVTKSQHLPIDRIAIVRVFPGAAGETAVVTVYDKKATVLSSFSGEAGTAIAMQSEAGEGVGTGTVGAIGGLALRNKQSRTEAQDEYDRTYIWFQDWVAVQHSGRVVADWTVPYQGKYKKSLDGPEFYEVVGREDLASSYRTRRAWKTGLTIGGYGLVFGGAAYTIVNLLGSTEDECDMGDPGYAACSDKAHDDMVSAITVGSIITASGLVVGLVGGFIDPHPVEAVEAKRMADEYNQGLKKKLGLASNQPAIEMEPGIAAVNGGAALTLSGIYW